MDPVRSYLTHLECPECHHKYNPDRVQTICRKCNSPLLACYDLGALAGSTKPDLIASRPRGIWRWAELLPVRQEKNRLTLGEGDSRLVPSQKLGSSVGLPNLFIKDESTNPTGSFKDRGLAVAVSRALELKQTEFIIPTAGNAGSSLAFYAARAGVQAHVYMPKDAPMANQAEIRLAGADLQLVDGLINDAARITSQLARRKKWFDISTFKEPYRVEGKKTMGFELAEAFKWQLPEVIVYPTGGGTGLVGMWKAFNELEKLGWIGTERPRMVSVQAEGCAPIVRAYNTGAKQADPWLHPHTIASGLRVPTVFADRLILRVLNESKGIALEVSDEEIIQAQKELAHEEGIYTSPEGAACWAGLKKLKELNWVHPNEKIVLYNTGNGLKYL